MMQMLSILGGTRKPGWLSILAVEGRAVLVHAVRLPGRRPKIRLLESFAVERGLAEALGQLRASRKLAGMARTTLIAASECTVTPLEAPPVPREERKEALRWQLKDVVNYPVENACIDVLDLPGEGLPAGRTAGVLVVSAAEQAVRDCVAPFAAAKVVLDVVDIPELAQRNVAALLEDENRGLVLLRLDATGMMLTLTFHGELVAVRRGEIGATHLAASDEGARGRAMERLILELQRSLDNFDRQYSHIPVSKVVVATHPPVAGLVEELGQGAYVPVVAMDLADALDVVAVPALRAPEAQAQYLLSIGAALRTGEPS